MIQEYRVLLAPLNVLEVSIVNCLANLHARCIPLYSFLDAPYRVNGVALSHLEVGRTDQRIWTKHDVEVREPGNR